MAKDKIESWNLLSKLSLSNVFLSPKSLKCSLQAFLSSYICNIVLLKSSLTIYDKNQRNFCRNEILFHGICILTCSNSFQYMLFGFSRYYNNIYIIFLNNPRLYSNDNRLTKISLSFIVISNGIVHPLVLLGPDFENSGILDSISKIKNYQNNFERVQNRNFVN